jgi:hypothetical protein
MGPAGERGTIGTDCDVLVETLRFVDRFAVDPG